jgi:hypothetical protein
MGNIWIQTISGSMIHLPILGPDINTPDSLPKILESMIPVGSIKSGVITPIVIDGYGIIMFDFTAPDRIGACVQCGACCIHPIEHCNNNCAYVLDIQYNVHKCKYLIINTGENKLGEPGQTSCSLYTNIISEFKGCLYGPQTKKEMRVWMTNCGFKFVR